MNRLFPALALAASVLVVSTACSPTPPADAGVKDAGGGTDAGNAGRDAGLPGGDAGPPGGDAGTPGGDSGLPGDDSGTPADDSGTPADDAGTPADDAGDAGMSGEDAGTTATGEPCATASECASTGDDAICFDEASSGHPSGYCSEQCSVQASDCAAGALCVALSGDVGLCFDECATEQDCREGYRCSGVDAGHSVCVSACTDDAHCPETGLCHTASGSCIDAPPPGWTCDAFFYTDRLCDCGCGVVDPDCADGTATCHTDHCAPPQHANPESNSQCVTPACGNGFLEPPELCDDGNTSPGDGCDANCRLEPTLESEPNDDGATATGTNDFDAAAADGPYSMDAYISAAFSPAGDDDVFAVTNPGAAAVEVVFATFDGNGIGSCAVATQVRVRDAAGTELGVDTDGGIGLCSLLVHTIGAGETVYAHVIDLDDDEAAAYHLVIDFP